MDKRAEIIASGLVQGVGFRYFIYKHALELGVKGFVKNLYDGNVQTVVEGTTAQIEALFGIIKTGPMHADVRTCKIWWDTPKNEFKSFEIRH